MPGSARKSAPPRSLGDAGKALWKAIHADLAPGWELDARELACLERACRCADELVALEAAIDEHGPTVTGSRGQIVVNPALTEARGMRLAMLRLLGAVEMVDPQSLRKSATPKQARARQAAEARWRDHG